MTPAGVIDAVAHAFAGAPGFEEVLLVGSAARSAELPPDLDFLVTTVDASQDYRQLAAALVAPRLNPVEIQLSDDSALLTMADGARIGLAAYPASSLIDRLGCYTHAENLAGERRVWAPGYWLPEAFCADVVDAHLLVDPHGRLATVQNLLRGYPRSLQDGITAFCREEITLKLPRVGTSGPITRTLCIADVATALVRLAFARDRIYLQGFHRLELQTSHLSPAGRSLVELAGRLVTFPVSGEPFATLSKEIHRAVHEH